jgi:hypothetical protein
MHGWKKVVFINADKTEHSYFFAGNVKNTQTDKQDHYIFLLKEEKKKSIGYQLFI